MKPVRRPKVRDADPAAVEAMAETAEVAAAVEAEDIKKLGSRLLK